MADQFISVREAAQTLGVSEKKIMDLVENRTLQAYRIAGQFLRLKKSEIIEIRSAGNVAQETVKYSYTQAERIRDFFYFNDFYIVVIIILSILLYIIFYL